MANLTNNDLVQIKEYVSFPHGAGNVFDFSDQTFSNMFRYRWAINIDDPKYGGDGTSKADRLVSFCEQEENEVVLHALTTLYHISLDVEEEAGSVVVKKDYFAFDRLLNRLGKRTGLVAEQVAFRNVTKQQLVDRAQSNEDSLLLATLATRELIAEFQARIRADNYLAVEELDLKSGLLGLLDEISQQLEVLLEILPAANGLVSDKNAKELSSWTKRYIDSAIPKLEAYIQPEAVATATVPVAVILACGGIGAMLTGFSPLGLGAGIYMGKHVVGELKSGVAADKLSALFESGE